MKMREEGRRVRESVCRCVCVFVCVCVRACVRGEGEVGVSGRGVCECTSSFEINGQLPS